MDNELGSEDCRMVEEFVALHPDLKEELDLLFQYKLSPDPDILFPGKEELLMVNGETPITLTNFEEWLVLYTDNELNAGQRNEVEKFIAINPELQKELALLQSTKLQPEQIVFEEKESLFRTEENPDSYRDRSIPARWWRVAATVLLLIGLGTATAVIVNNRTKDGNEIVKGTESGEKLIPETPVITPVQKENIPVTETAVADNQHKDLETIANQNSKNTAVKNDNIIVKDKLKDVNPALLKKDEPVFADKNNKPSNNLPQPDKNPYFNKTNATNETFANIKPPKEIINPQKPLTTSEVTNVIPVSYNNNDDELLEEGGTNKKNRGFFRKLVRTFEKRTNITATDDDKLLVGGFSINLK